MSVPQLTTGDTALAQLRAAAGPGATSEAARGCSPQRRRAAVAPESPRLHQHEIDVRRPSLSQQFDARVRDVDRSLLNARSATNTSRSAHEMVQTGTRITDRPQPRSRVESEREPVRPEAEGVHRGVRAGVVAW